MVHPAAGVWTTPRIRIYRPGRACWKEAGKAGYSAIELGPYGYLPIDAELVANELKKNGLAIVAGTIFHDLLDADNQESVLHAG